MMMTMVLKDWDSSDDGDGVKGWDSSDDGDDVKGWDSSDDDDGDERVGR